MVSSTTSGEVGGADFHRGRSKGWWGSLVIVVPHGRPPCVGLREDRCVGVRADGLTANGFACGWTRVPTSNASNAERKPSKWL